MLTTPRFGAVFNCLDGRIQLPVINFLMSHWGFPAIDNITAEGPARWLAVEPESPQVAIMRTRLELSVNQHNAEKIALVGHDECAGNPVDVKTHYQHISQGLDEIKSWGFRLPLVSLWVDIHTLSVRILEQKTFQAE